MIHTCVAINLAAVINTSNIANVPAEKKLKIPCKFFDEIQSQLIVLRRRNIHEIKMCIDLEMIFLDLRIR